MIAKTTEDGTAAAETALCADDNTAANRTEAEARADADVTGPWVDATGNDALECTVCGAPE